MDGKLQSLLENTLNKGLYHIIISSPRRSDGMSKIKIRPILLKDELMFQETIYIGTKVFHKNNTCNETIEKIENYMLTDFKQCEIEHTNIKGIVFSNKKGKITVKTKLISGQAKTEDNNSDFE